MPFSKLGKKEAALVVLGVGILCVAGNLWATLNRSTIPRSLDGTVTGKEIGFEKHPGEDDVCWLLLDNGGKIHVDAEIWKRVNEGDHLEKESWSTELMIGENVMRLEPSADARGMIPVMLGTLLLLAVPVVLLWREGGRFRHVHRHTDQD